ncbi:MAG: DUF1573 domain-containing protein [Candidatus Atribacteria bacterium]|nr:DUF1573 domain-containing protein [Candidatus Atribacteria bacterium]
MKALLSIYPAPQISLSEEKCDFGKIKEDERPVHIFTIKNTGGEELIISRVRASCGCTATMLSSDHILLGKSAELKTTFIPTGYEGLVGKVTLENSGENLIKIISLKTSADYLIPLRTEVELDSGKKKDIAVVLLKDKIKEEKK